MRTNDNVKDAGTVTPRRRKSYTINKAFQWKYTLLTIGTVFVVSGFVSIVLFNVLHQQARSRAIAPMSPAVVDSLTMIVVAACAFGLIVSLALGVSVFVFTHRVAGPVHVIGLGLEQLAKGQIPNLRPLRRSDEFKDVHAQLCATVKRIERERAARVEQLTELQNLAQSGTIGGTSDGLTACNALVKRIDALRQEALEACGDGRASSFVSASTASTANASACGATESPA